MSITSYKRLTVLLAVVIGVLLVLVLHYNLKLQKARLDTKAVEQGTWVAVMDFDRCRDRALQAEPQKAVEYLDVIDQSPPRWWTTNHGNLGRIIEVERASAIRDVINYLRQKTGEDLGDDPQKWVKKYSVSSRPTALETTATTPSVSTNR